MTARARVAVIAVQVLAVCAAGWTLSPFVRAHALEGVVGAQTQMSPSQTCQRSEIGAVPL